MQDCDITQIAHVNNKGRPLCSHDGKYLHLCEPDEFERLPKECRCQRCELFLGHRTTLNPLSDKEQQLLMEISRRTPDRDSWCPVTDLCKKKTEAVLTSLSRSLRRLEVQGLVETKTDSHNKSFVRLSNKNYSDKGRLFDVFEMGE
jgi:hypothetical protein